MKIVIDIPNDVYEDFKDGVDNYSMKLSIYNAIDNGTPLPKGQWKEIYAESDESWIEFKCPHCGGHFGIESGEYGWHYGDTIPWKACPMCGGFIEAESEVSRMTNEERLKQMSTRELARELASIEGYEGNVEAVNYWEYWLSRESEVRNDE